jgi:hypothetical protein
MFELLTVTDIIVLDGRGVRVRTHPPHGSTNTGQILVKYWSNGRGVRVGPYRPPSVADVDSEPVIIIINNNNNNNNNNDSLCVNQV